MGLLNFWNKKKLDPAPSPPSRDFDISADLPPIGADLGQNIDDMQNMPVHNNFGIPDFGNDSLNSGNNTMNSNLMRSNSSPSFNQDLQMSNQEQNYVNNASSPKQSQTSNYQTSSLPQSNIFNQNNLEPQTAVLPAMPPPFDSRSLSVNVPSLDFSMPPLDDAPLIDEPLRPTELPAEGINQSNSTLIQNTGMTTDSQVKTSGSTESKYLDVEDLKKLFPNDDWKEPDWSTFEAYHEDKIEEPRQEDFGIVEELPAFIEEEKISEPSPVEITHTTTPIELFIRGSEYNRVFSELDQMNKAVAKIDSKIVFYEDILKREESLVSESKTQMEYLYKKLSSIDKKIFAQ